jgi:hypothetical protein
LHVSKESDVTVGRAMTSTVQGSEECGSFFLSDIREGPSVKLASPGWSLVGLRTAARKVAYNRDSKPSPSRDETREHVCPEPPGGTPPTGACKLLYVLLMTKTPSTNVVLEIREGADPKNHAKVKQRFVQRQSDFWRKGGRYSTS